MYEIITMEIRDWAICHSCHLLKTSLDLLIAVRFTWNGSALCEILRATYRCKEKGKRYLYAQKVLKFLEKGKVRN
jgi:hypothetical protein